jgi:hypothetical protein
MDRQLASTSANLRSLLALVEAPDTGGEIPCPEGLTRDVREAINVGRDNGML